jgi:hypothetical protein
LLSFIPFPFGNLLKIALAGRYDGKMNSCNNLIRNMDKIEAVQKFSFLITKDIWSFKDIQFSVFKVMDENEFKQKDTLSITIVGAPKAFGGFELCYLKREKRFFLKYYDHGRARAETFRLTYSDLKNIPEGILHFLKHSAQKSKSMSIRSGRIRVTDKFEL